MVCTLFGAHNNVETMLSMPGTINYLFKHICKRLDRFTVQERQNRETGERFREINEIRENVDARFVSSTFALWKFFGYDMLVNALLVQGLQIHV